MIALCRLRLMVGNRATELENLNVMRRTGTQGGKGQVTAHNAIGKVDVVATMDRRDKAVFRIA